MPDTLTAKFQAKFQQALAHHQKGQLAQAKIIYEDILKTHPRHPESLHLLGLIAYQTKNYQHAVDLISNALKLCPNNAEYYSNLGAALKSLHQIDAAVACYDKAIAIRPDYAEAYTNRGNALKALNQPEAAITNYDRAIAIKPNYAEAYYNRGNALKELNQLEAAATSFGKATEIKPNYVDAHINLGNVLKELKRHVEAEAAYREALRIKPDNAKVLNNLGTLLMELKRHGEAETAYREALRIKPDYAEVLNNLGILLMELKRHDEAETAYRGALRIEPDYAEVLNNLGILLMALKRHSEAETAYREALRIKPDYAEAHNNLGTLLMALEHYREAETAYHEALRIKPDYAEAHNNLGTALMDQGRLEEAVASYRQALLIKTDDAEVYNNLGNALMDQGRLEEAVAGYRQALLIKTDYAEVYNNLGSALMDMRRLMEAEVSFHQAIEIKPDYAKAYNNLGNALMNMGRLKDAEVSYRHAIEIKPDYAEAYSNMLFLYGYQSTLAPSEYLTLARGWEQASLPERDRQTAAGRAFQRLPLAGRRLKIGYVSGDYKNHAASFFLKKLFACHDHTQMEVFAYSTHGKLDSVTKEFKILADHWVPLTGLTDAAAAERIKMDGIDVLIDLSGHTAHNRLGIFALRAAPVQTHYLGFFATTGLSEMDYWIGDDILTPAETDCHFTERVWRLPRVWVGYEGKTDAPSPDWQPDPNGMIRLGSFNNLGKLTPATLELWAQALHALPESRLLLKNKELSDNYNRQRILDAFAGHGISSSRIELQDWSVTPSWSSHMAYYNRVDIALDPIGGVGGGTTTCDALWMALPLITLIGDRMASRMTASMLHAVGHPEWIARSEAEYVDKVVSLARNVDLRRRLRADQCSQMAQSALCDTRGLAKELERAYRDMFDLWFNRSETDISL